MHCSLEVVQQFDGKAVRESEELRREAGGLSAGRKKSNCHSPGVRPEVGMEQPLQRMDPRGIVVAVFLARESQKST